MRYSKESSSPQDSKIEVFGRLFIVAWSVCLYVFIAFRHWGSQRVSDLIYDFTAVFAWCD